MLAVTLSNCYVINGYYIQQLSNNLSSPTESSLLKYPQSNYVHKQNPSSVFDYAIGSQLVVQQQQQQQSLLDHNQNVSLNHFDDCIQKQQLQKILPKMTNISLTTMSPIENAQQLEQFIISLNLNNLTDFDQQSPSSFSSDMDKFTVNNELEREEFEPELENKIKHPAFQNRASIPKHIKAAVVTHYSMEYRPVNPNLFVMPSVTDRDEEEDTNAISQARIIEVAPHERPLQIHFKSPSNKIKVMQIPIERQQKFEPIIERTEDEPQKFFHQIKKPIIQEVHEIIMPYRKVIQEIQPVVEQIHTVVSSSSASNSVSRITSPKLHGNKLLNNQNMNKFTILEKQHLLPSKVPSQTQHLEQEFEDATLSPVLIGVEQQVDPLQESNIATTSTKKHYLNIVPIMSSSTSSSLALPRSANNNLHHRENFRKYFYHNHLPKITITPQITTKSKISSNRMLEQSKRHFL